MNAYNKTEADSDTEKKLVITSEEGKDRGTKLRDTISMYRINKQEGYILQHREYSLYFIII